MMITANLDQTTLPQGLSTEMSNPLLYGEEDGSSLPVDGGGNLSGSGGGGGKRVQIAISDQVLLAPKPAKRGLLAPKPADGGGGGSEVQLPCVVLVLNFVMFGGGKYWGVPLLFGGGLCAAFLYTAYASIGDASSSVWMEIAQAVEVAVNAYFGYGFCRDARITQLVREVAAPHGVAERDAMRALGRWAWAAVAVAAMGVGLWAWGVISGGYTTFEWHASVIGNTYIYLGMIYLCALWLWTNWLFWRAGRSVISCSVTASSVAQWQASSAVFGLLDAMRSASQVWAVNHAVRAVTTVACAEAMVHFLSLPPETMAEWHHHVRGLRLAYTSAVALFFLVVLATAAAPGHVTTDFYKAVLGKLADLHSGGKLADSGGGGSGDGDDCCGVSGGRCVVPPPKDTPTALMQRIAAARAGKGMHFAGVPMTVEKAISVGWVVYYLTKYFAARQYFPTQGGGGPASCSCENGTAVLRFGAL
jgi:hypothetical protein